MATSSIFNNVRIADKASAKRLVDAIESSRDASTKEVQLKHPVVEPAEKTIKELFKRK